jgi:CelD/BcsL family acetyltransferase involved in cellulose biosynthesis
VQPLVLLAQVAGRMVGIAPLMITSQRILGRKRQVVEFIGTHAADYCDFIVEPAQPTVVSLMLEWLIERADRWDLLHLLNIAETSPLMHVLPQTFGQRGYATDVRPLYECPTRVFGDRSEDQRLLRKKDIRMHFNRLRRQGEVDCKWYVGPAEIERYLESFFQQHIDRWSGTPTPSFFRDDRQRNFYRELVRLLTPNRWLLFSVMSFNQKPIAFEFGYEYDSRICLIKSAFDPEYRRYAPGILHLKYLLEDAMDRKVREVDFTVGEEKYKYRFANHSRINYAARAYHRSMFYGVDRLLLYAKDVAKRSDALTRLGKRVKPWLGDSLHRMGL